VNNGNKSGGFPVAPHGILACAALAILVILAIHMLGFSAMGAVKVG
jgi:hypothetical protein